MAASALDLWDLDITVIVPTRNEAPNVVPLLTRIEPLGVGRVLFVDDSDDDTADVITRAALSFNTKIEVVHRRAGERHGGLSGAVVDGFARASSPWCCVMDGDLQHPPEVVAALAQHAAQRGVDLVVATRHNWDSINEGLSWWRRGLSWAAGRAAFRLLPAQLAQVNDPLSGFFLIRTDSVKPDRIEADGFKILLEIVATHPELSVGEVSFHFAHRLDGQSKGSITEGIRYLRHLVGLRRRVRAQTHQPSPAPQP
jgi:dolichol-phosphate mannosyltransferase